MAGEPVAPIASPGSEPGHDRPRASSIYRFSGWKRRFLGINRTRGFSESGYRTDDLHLYLIDNTPDWKSRDTVLPWFKGGIAGVGYAGTPDCT